MKYRCTTCDSESDDPGLLVPTYRKAGELRSTCWTCWRDQSRAYRKRNRNKRKSVIAKAKDVPCADCGVRYPTHVMDFDHLEDKLFTIGNAFNTSLDAISTEIAKCDVVCANCHRQRTWLRVLVGRKDTGPQGC